MLYSLWKILMRRHSIWKPLQVVSLASSADVLCLESRACHTPKNRDGGTYMSQMYQYQGKTNLASPERDLPQRMFLWRLRARVNVGRSIRTLAIGCRLPRLGPFLWHIARNSRQPCRHRRRLQHLKTPDLAPSLRIRAGHAEAHELHLCQTMSDI